jgi:cytoskeletal protein CcmA (bactofilin family)
MERTSEIGPSIVIRGEVVAQEDLVVAGRIEGTIEMEGHRLTVNKDAELKATIHAREIAVAGAVVGTILAVERVELLQTGEVQGDINTPSLRMSDGAGLTGRVEMDKAARSEKAERHGLQLAS